MKEMSLIETQVAIKYLKDNFENALAKKLNLVRVSAPLFVKKDSGLNDHLNGTEERVSFSINGETIEIVQSLAKWKRYALAKYNFPKGTGLYTDMNAIRKDEVMDSLHSIYVDQWDWEMIIDESERTKRFLFSIVNKIYSVIYKVANLSEKKWGFSYNLPNKIFRISTKELEKMYPDKTPSEREYLITKKHRAVFIYQIGWPLKNKAPHDGRAADYDDWKLNGDIILFDDAINSPIELSSMGIRVNKDSLVKQLKYKNELGKLENPYCQSILNDKLPLTIGGGIGQSRLCMYYLQKKHIGEVQSSYWSDEALEDAHKKNIKLL
ncbi:MAG: aspartate--ammonia ligase [Bacilli bacterium]|nr:aspartate--ammonia ligase [Bacilli bacterium]